MEGVHMVNTHKKYLMILEVSQKQAFIFKNNKLSQNIANSNLIEYVTASDYFDYIVNEVRKDNNCFYSEEKNMVYSGGGHTVLVFEDKEKAIEFAKMVTRDIKEKFSEIEYFVTISPLKEENPAASLLELSKKLEKKKSIRKTAFEQTKFGFGLTEKESHFYKEEKQRQQYSNSRELDGERKLKEAGYQFVKEIDNLGMEEGKSNFIAVVHIDGNAMGERIQKLNEKTPEENGLNGLPWEEYRKKLREFSDAIDADFKAAFSKMLLTIANNIEKYGLDEKLCLKEKNFPIRRIITAGDDICFLTEGRIGIEASAIFLEELSKLKNKVDQKGYSACAGICIIHSKYPFYKAYELAEELCSNTKKEMAKQYGTRNISALDWHIEFGELEESISDIKEQYKTFEGENAGFLQLRPYAIYNGEREETVQGILSYEEFLKYMKFLLDEDERVARSKLKELRGIFKQGEKISKNFLKAYHLEPLIEYRNKTIAEQVVDNKTMEMYREKKLTLQNIFYDITNLYEKNEKEGSDYRNLYFDGIEIMDCFLPLERGE